MKSVDSHAIGSRSGCTSQFRAPIVVPLVRDSNEIDRAQHNRRTGPEEHDPARTERIFDRPRGDIGNGVTHFRRRVRLKRGYVKLGQREKRKPGEKERSSGHSTSIFDPAPRANSGFAADAYDFGPKYPIKPITKVGCDFANGLPAAFS